jgi:hypothetical protein
MNTTEDTTMVKHTTEFIICPVCLSSNQFIYVVVHEGSQYYLGTKCSRERCKHFDDFKAVPYRIASEYLSDEKK